MSAPSLRDLWLSEMWKACPEESRTVRAEKRKADKRQQWDLEQRHLAPSVHAESTGCAETALPESA